MKHCMIDLETYGLRPGAAPCSIGAVMFDPASQKLGATFYRNIDFASCEALGMAKEPATEEWWADQSEAAQAALLSDQRPILEVIEDFRKWWGTCGAVYVWSQGANFDEPHVVAWFDAASRFYDDLGLDPIEVPWKFWNVRCSRTVLALGNRRPNRSGLVAHHALDDAKAQAIAVMAALKGRLPVPGAE